MAIEAEHSESKADFIFKMAMAQKEINVSIYWLELLERTDYINSEQFKSINKVAEELIKLVTSIIKSSKANLRRAN